MNKLRRAVFGLLFIIGVCGALIGGSQTIADNNIPSEESPLAALIKSVKMAQEAQAINEGRWNVNVYDLQEDSLTQIEELLANDTNNKDAVIAVQN
jgi:hypothetical protein